MTVPGRVVVITGCSAGGLGAALAERFASEGCTVFATARNVAKMESLSGGIHKVELDVLSDASVTAAIKAIIEQAGRIDILVNNAGGNHRGALLDLPVEDIDALFQTNVFGVMRVTKAVAPHMAKRSSGLIINVGSVAGNVPTPWNGPYAASKAALHAYTDTLDMELRPFSIRVLLLAPGMVRTNIAVNSAAKQAAPSEDSLYTKYYATINAPLASDDQMPADEFAQRTVKAALSASPPAYMSIAPLAWTGWFFGFVPRGMRLNMMWKMFSA